MFKRLTGGFSMPHCKEFQLRTEQLNSYSA